jgi:hypothetical protein
MSAMSATHTHTNKSGFGMAGVCVWGGGYLLHQDSHRVVREHVTDEQHRQQVVAVLSPGVDRLGPTFLNRCPGLAHLHDDDGG